MTAKLSFDSIEQLDELTHSMGWATEYRQLQSGPFQSTFTVLEGDSWFLMEEQSSRTVEVQAPAPPGMYVLALVEGTPGAVNGQPLSSDHLFVQSPDSDLRVSLPASTKVTQIGIPADQLEECVLVAVPDLPVSMRGVRTIATARGRLTKTRAAMRSAILTPADRGATQEEIVSGIVEDIVSVMIGPVQAIGDERLHGPAAQHALARAMEYIEAHMGGTIRIASVCRYAGITPRSLERVFARELYMSPQQYVKARRLNAVRRRLLTEGREPGLRVTNVATDYGFVHMGRFAVDYRNHFGENPIETLRTR